MPTEATHRALFQAPTLANPQALADIDALRQELHRTNVLLLQQFDQLVNYRRVVEQMGQSLSSIMLAHLDKDAERLCQVLDTLRAKHVRVVASGSMALQ